MENGSGGVEGLEIILNIQRREDVLSVSDRQMAAVGVVGGAILGSGSDDIRKTFLVVCGKTPD